MNMGLAMENLSMQQYAAHGLHIAIVGGPGVGKKHVHRNVRAMRTSSIDPVFYFHPRDPLRPFRDELDEMKRLFSRSHSSCDPYRHMDIVWYFASDSWDRTDTIFVSELSELCDVIAVIAKWDLRSLRLDPVTGKTEAQLLEETVRFQFYDIPIVHCSDPTLNPAFWVPSVCKFGHDKNNFHIQPEEKKWTCVYAADGNDGYPFVCQDFHVGAYTPTGYEKLLKVTLALAPKVYIRSVRRAKANKNVVERRVKRENAWALAGVGLALFAMATTIGTSILSVPSDSTHAQVIERVYENLPLTNMQRCWRS